MVHLRYANTRQEARVNLPAFLFSQIVSVISRVKENGSQIKYHTLIHLILKHHFLMKESGKEKWLDFLSSPINGKGEEWTHNKRVKREKR